MVTIEIPGNIQIDLEEYQPLFNLIYGCSSDGISEVLKKAVDELTVNAKKNKKSILNSHDFNLLSSLVIAFEKLKETPVILLIAED